VIEARRTVGGVLLQEDDQGVERVVAYGSRSCNGAELRYSSFEGELPAAVYFFCLWGLYLYEERFQLKRPPAAPVDFDKFQTDGQTGALGLDAQRV
jgi:hypothetical protein